MQGTGVSGTLFPPNWLPVAYVTLAAAGAAAAVVAPLLLLLLFEGRSPARPALATRDFSRELWALFVGFKILCFSL